MKDHNLKLIVDENGNYDNCPAQLITEAAEDGGVPMLRLKGPFIQADKINKNGRKYVYEELKPEVDRFIAECVETHHAVGNLEHPKCFSTPNFEVLTDKGWKPFLSLEVGDLVWSRNPDKIAELKPVERVINQPYHGDTYTISGRNIRGDFTAEHQMLVEDRYGNVEYRSIKEIYENRRGFSHHSIPKTLRVVRGSTGDTKVFKGVQRIKENPSFGYDSTTDVVMNRNTFCKLLGLWLAEGSIRGAETKSHGYRAHGINIVQSLTSNPEKCKLIDELWQSLPPEFRTHESVYRTANGNFMKMWSISDLRVGQYFVQLGNMYDKHLPEEVFDYSINDLETLLYWFALGDGRKPYRLKKYDNIILDNIMDVFSVSERLIKDLSYVQLLCGVGSSIEKVETKNDYVFAGRVIKAENKKPLFFSNILANMRISLTTTKKLQIVKHENVDAGAYCLTVKDNHNFFVNYGGKCYWTGNCAEIDPKEAAFTIDSLELDEPNKQWIGVATILAEDRNNGIFGTPNGNILASLVQHGQRVGFSTRGVGKIVGNTVRDFHICTIDCVWKPSIDQFCEGVLESKTFKYEGERIVECVEGAEQVVEESETLSRLRRELGEAKFWNEFNRRFSKLAI